MVCQLAVFSACLTDFKVGPCRSFPQEIWEGILVIFVVVFIVEKLGNNREIKDNVIFI